MAQTINSMGMSEARTGGRKSEVTILELSRTLLEEADLIRINLDTMCERIPGPTRPQDSECRVMESNVLDEIINNLSRLADQLRGIRETLNTDIVNKIL